MTMNREVRIEWDPENEKEDRAVSAQLAELIAKGLVSIKKKQVAIITYHEQVQE